VDIWAWIAQKLNLGQKRPEPELEDIMCTSLIQSTPITAVLAETQHAPFVTMSESCSLQEAIDRMAQSNIHRIAIVDDKNNFRSMVTRSRILSYIDKCYSHVVL
jgi:CBS domain-containing protein